MRKEELTVTNLKCGGCANTIKKSLLATDGVSDVEVDLENSKVIINSNQNVERNILAEKLFTMGYPEATEKNGLLAQIRSYGSCITGKFSSND
jgi:copper chaperone